MIDIKLSVIIYKTVVRLRHYDNLGTARFITFSCYHRLRLLTSDETILPFLEELEAKRRIASFSALGYVIMPDHVHLVLHPTGNLAMGAVIGEIKRRSAFRIISLWKREKREVLDRIRAPSGRMQDYAFWQPRGYDHNCRSAEFTRDKINYCHMNPVKAGLISDPSEWPWSSYRWYNGDKSGIVQIDAIEL